MISERHFLEFIAPYYRQIVPRLKEMGAVVLIDTDGDVTQMVPWLLREGIDGVLPLERQAGVDGLKLRQQFPTLRMVGHYDKMVMNRGEVAVRAEFERLIPIMKAGGFIPSVDHQTPPGVSLEEYRLYVRLLREYPHAAAEATGIGRHPRAISDEDWVLSCERDVEANGLAQFLTDLLHILRLTIPKYLGEPQPVDEYPKRISEGDREAFRFLWPAIPSARHPEAVSTAQGRFPAASRQRP